MVRWQLRFVALLSVLFCAMLPAYGSTLTVTNTGDSGSGSLRDTIAAAAPGDTINFSLAYPATITLSSTLWITKSVTISGPGANQLAISGNNSVEVLYVLAGAVADISGVTIENGSAMFGGGIMNFASTVKLTDSAVTGNSAAVYNGGAIYNFDQGTLIITRSTISGNSAAGDGGGIANYQDSTTTLINSTVANNSATGIGGGIANDNSSFTSINSTIAGNSGTSAGGGITNNNGTMTLKSTLFASNKGGNCALTGGAATSDGYNLSDDATCSTALSSAADSNNVSSAGLDSKGLQNNGGGTSTIALLPASPAVDGVPVADCTLTDAITQVATDQRGTTRPQGAACDIGAFELVQSTAFSSFNAKLEIHDGEHRQSFELNSTFTLGPGSSGIDALTQAVNLQVATYQVAIPAGSFRQLRRREKKGACMFEGRIGSTALAIQIFPLEGNSYRFKAEAAPVNLGAVSNPVKVVLTIGSDQGTAMVFADIDR